MARRAGGSDAIATLREVRDRVRQLASERRWFADALGRASDDFQSLVARYVAEDRDRQHREQVLARYLLASGRTVDPPTRDSKSCITVMVRDGLCPKPLADQLAAHDWLRLPESLEKQSAAAALLAFDWELVKEVRGVAGDVRKAMAAEDQAKIESGEYVTWTWRITISRPHDWRTPVSPYTLDSKELKTFLDHDLRAISLFRLGGLADLDSIRPRVPEPPPTGDVLNDAQASLVWDKRFPDIDLDDDGSEPTWLTRRMAEVAKEMLLLTEGWIKESEGAAGDGFHPAVRLGHAIEGIRSVTIQTGMFRDLARDRAAAHTRRKALLESMSRSSFASFEEMVASSDFALKCADLISPREPVEYIRELRRRLDEGLKWCELARIALCRGGAEQLDAARTPGGSGSTVEIGIKVREAESVFYALQVGLCAWRSPIDEDIAKMEELGEWFTHIQYALDAAAAVGKEDDFRATRPGSKDAAAGQSDQRSKMTRAVKLAGESLEWAVAKRPDFEDLASIGGRALLPIHEWLKEQDCPSYPTRSGTETLPAAATWLRYVREYRRAIGQTNKPVKARSATGKSVVRADLI